MEKVYLAQWVQGVRKDERFSEYSKILGLIETAKKPADVFAGISYDVVAIREAIARQNVYSSGFCKYLLLRLEVSVAEHDRIHEFNAKSIEHILPQDPETVGYWAKHHDLSTIKDYVDSIGNLVLLSKSKNSAARNYDFDKKKKKYLMNKVSDYPRSIQVLDYSDWDRSTIDARTKEAQKLIIADF